MTSLTEEERSDIKTRTALWHGQGRARKAFGAAIAAGFVIAGAAELMRGAYYHLDLLNPNNLSDNAKLFMGSGKGIGQAMYYMLIPYAVAKQYIFEKSMEAKDYARARLALTKDRSIIAGAMLMTAGVLQEIPTGGATASGGNFDPYDLAGYALGVGFAMLASKLTHKNVLKHSETLDRKIENELALYEQMKPKEKASPAFG